MDLISEFFARVFHPRELLQWGGYPVMMAVIFAETGLLVGFFLPGDSLLVTAGFLVQGGYMDPLELGPSFRPVGREVLNPHLEPLARQSAHDVQSSALMLPQRRALAVERVAL